jgi:peptide/nickel transport system substrate-binding protein
VHANEGVILPKHAWSKLPFDQWLRNGPWFVENLVVSGPFTLESWKPQQEIVLRRNDRYYETGKPYLERVILRIIPDASSQLTQLLGGDVDLVRQVPAAMAKKIAENPRTRLISFWPSQFTALIWNLRNPLFDRAEVRRAMTLAIDRQTIVDTIWNGYARTSASPYISSVWGHNPAIKVMPYDPEAARELLAGQGWSDHDGDGVVDRDGRAFSFDLLVNAGNQERVDAAVMIQEQLRRIGVQARPLTLDWNTIGDLLDRRDFDATITGLSVETSLDLSPYFHSESIDLRLNLGSYANPEVDRLLEQARAQINLEDSKPFLFRIQEIFDEEQPQTILWEPQRLIGISRRIEDARPTAIGTLHNLQEWWLAPGS